jgi:hypothetical protein
MSAAAHNIPTTNLNPQNTAKALQWLGQCVQRARSSNLSVLTVGLGRQALEHFQKHIMVRCSVCSAAGDVKAAN